MTAPAELVPRDALQRVTRPNPFSARRMVEAIEVVPGVPLAHYIGRYHDGPVTVWLDGELISPERRMTVIPRPGQSLAIVPVVAGGGGGGKQILRTLAMVAVMTLAYFVGGVVATQFAWGLTSTIMGVATAGAIIVGGSMLTNYALSPHTTPSSSEQSYSWAGPVATIRQGAVIPKVYGKTRVNLAGSPIASYTVANGRQMYLHALYSLGWGPLKSISDVRINDNPAENYPDCSIETRLGTNDQTPIAEFSTVNHQRPQNARIRTGAPTEIAGERTDTQGLIVQVYFPKGLWAGPDSSNKYDPWTVWIQLEYRKEGDSSWSSVTRTFTDNSPSGGLYYDIRVDNLPAGKYDVRISKLGSANYASQTPRTGNGGDIPSFEDSTRRGEECWLRAITELVYQGLAYPNIGLLAVHALATDKLNGNVSVSALVEAEVPDSIAGTPLAGYAGDNPAVIAYDALANQLYGTSVKPELIDMEAWVEWAAWCDELVPDGNGGQIKRATWNGMYAEEGNVWDFDQSVARLSRAVARRTGTKFTVAVDRPQDPVMVFTVGNIIKDSFKETWLALQDRANSIEVYYYDKDDDYKRKSVVVEDAEAIAAGKPIVVAPAVDLRGATTAAQAWREGMYALRSNKYLLRICEFEAPAEAIGCGFGDVIGVQHDVPQWGQGGRIISADGTEIVLDRAIAMDEGKSYVITCCLPTVQRAASRITGIAGLRISVDGYDGTCPVKRFVSNGRDLEVVGYGSGYVDLSNVSGLTEGDACELWDTNVVETRNVITAPGESDRVRLVSAFSVDPAPSDIYTFGELNRQMKLFRVASIGHGLTDQTFSIRGAEYNPAILEDLEPKITTRVTTTPGVGVSNLSLLEIPNPTYDLPAIAVSWTPGPLTLGAYVCTKINDAPETQERVVVGQSSTILTSAKSGDTVTVRIIGYGARGADNHDTAPAGGISLLGVGRLPANVAGFYASACVSSPASVALNWSANPAADQVDHYEIRYGGTIANPVWEFSTPLAPNPGASATSATFSSGPGQYLIVAVNVGGQASSVATICSAVVGGSTGGSGGGGYGGGSYCFSGNVEIETPDGWARFDSLLAKFRVRNDYGDFDAELLTHNYKGPMLDFSGAGELVTPDHLMRYERGWHAASWHYPSAPRVQFAGKVFNAHVLSGVPGEQCFRLRNGDVAHNSKAATIDEMYVY